MENDQLLKEVTARAEKWLGDSYDAETRADVKRMLDADDKTASSEQAVCAASWAPAPTV